jgi:hypothetical protein
MRLSSIGILSAVTAFVLPLATLAASSTKPQPKTKAAVIAADDGWEKA